jgi:O-antigen ligase
MPLAFDRPAIYAGLALLGVVWGAVVALAGLNALYLCASLIACAFILRDYRAGVVLIILLMPVSTSALFPHAMLGITSLNPLNLLLAGTFAACLLQCFADGDLPRQVPGPLLWLYLAPILLGGAIGASHVGEIAPAFLLYDLISFDDTLGYLREMVFKPLLLVVFALLVGAAVSKSARPERFLIPALVSICLMDAMVIAYVLRSGIALGQLASNESREFLSELGLHANDLGRLFAMAYALLLFTWAAARHPGLRFALLGTMALTAVALMLTFSRGAFVGFLVVNALFVLWRRNAGALLPAGALAVVAALALPGAVYDRMAAGAGEGLNAISAGRIDGLWLPLLPETLRSPIYGSGLGSILWSEPMRRGVGEAILPVTHPHNAYLQAQLDLGVVGLVLLCAYFMHVWRGFRALSADAALSPLLRGFYQGAAAGLLSILVSDLTDSSLVPRPEQIYLWLAIGMLYGQRARQQWPVR